MRTRPSTVVLSSSGRRWNEVTQALNDEVEALDDEAAYQPEVMDVRGAMAALPEEERDAVNF